MSPKLVSSIQLQRHLYALAVGTVAGGTVGLVGFGGAQVVIPSLTLPASFANLSQLSATGVSLASLSISSLASGYKFWDENKVHVPLALAIGIPSVVSARIGSHFAKKLSGDALALIFNGFSIILMPTHYWIQHRRQSWQEAIETAEADHNTMETELHLAYPSNLMDDALKIVQHASYGVLCGVLSALMGVGGLPFTMSYLSETTDLPHHSVQGTAVCAMLPSILVSAASRVASIPLVTAGYVALGAMVGGYSGANMALHLTEDQLRHLYMGSLVVFGSRSVFGAARNTKRIYTGRS